MAAYPPDLQRMAETTANAVPESDAFKRAMASLIEHDLRRAYDMGRRDALSAKDLQTQSRG